MSTRRARPNESHANEPILLATHGLTEAESAVRAAAQLSDATGRPISVITVLEPPPLVAGEYGFVIPVENLQEERHDALLARVRRQIADVVGAAAKWTVDVRSGDPAATIAKQAQSIDAALIVMGLGHHQLMDRVFGSETMLHTLRSAHRPIFAVPQAFSALPRRAIAAMDFSGADMAAARGALALLPSLTSIALVHVAPRWDLEPLAYTQWRGEYERGVAPAFARAMRELDAPPSVTVTSTIREGKPSKEVLKVAEEESADVIIVGSRGLGFLDRVLVGSTATGIIRGAQSCIFAFPIVAPPARSKAA